MRKQICQKCNKEFQKRNKTCHKSIKNKESLFEKLFIEILELKHKSNG